MFNKINEGAIKINNLVRKTRREQGMTQEELAKRVGITRPYLSDIENDKRQVRGELMIRIAVTLGVKVEDIFLISAYNITDKIESSMGEVGSNV
ncbi:MAG: helix-turn-helix transcriptional regulator [Syntrophomonas sp.]